MINFCTLFDSNYLDKALVMYNSLVRVNSDFTLYIMCFDDISYEIITDMKLEHIVLAKLSDFETDELKSVKSRRTKAEYCWTCTPAVIDFFIKSYNLDNCTYIDADLYFFSDPKVLLDEIQSNKADVAILEHRFSNNKSDKKAMQKSGKFCVEFNYFNDSQNAVKALNWWKNSCLEWCYQKYEPAKNGRPERYGDQKYLEQFSVLFNNVHEIENVGAGVAPWNLKQYKLVEKNNEIVLKHSITGKVEKLVFYHFQNLKYINKNLININSQCRDKELKFSIYYPYLYEIEETRLMLAKQYNLILGIKKSYSSNKLKAFIQRSIMPYRIRIFSDLVNINKLIETIER